MTTRATLRAECGRCFALCCVAPAFRRSSEFAIDKPAGVPCLHLAEDHRCSIHERLRPEGFPGCTAYDCFGAGQRLAQETFGGRDWRVHHEVAEPMLAALPVMRALHELLWYLQEALDLPTSDPIRDELVAVTGRVEAAAASGTEALAEVDAGALRAATAPLLREASRLAREGLGGADHAGDDLSGADLRGADLRGVSFRGALLIGTRLDGADLDRVDLLGADIRGADLRGARLAGALYLTRTQLGGATGDRRTTLPEALEPPGHWAG
ncbi:MAG TPA: pentapeptide repeat-containing protein [Nocardioides sp.]|uniref:pentapeptide repeat-containing protein n=1 Tax=Nocardioides sp. TaxID=35761 RepID=UPI002F40B745